MLREFILGSVNSVIRPTDRPTIRPMQQYGNKIT